MWRGRAGALPAAIGALCRALPPGSRPAPETFRLAKFDRPEAVRAGEAGTDPFRPIATALIPLHPGFAPATLQHRPCPITLMPTSPFTLVMSSLLPYHHPLWWDPGELSWALRLSSCWVFLLLA
uniref:Uncharacterized protein n=1 Tax=Gopherus evgoodei TaxID=1825980 RepID=A0A8C4VSI3_9SAUR